MYLDCEVVDAVGIEPTTCRLRVAGKPFFTNYYHFPLSAREPLITGPSRVLSLPPVYAKSAPVYRLPLPATHQDAALHSLENTRPKG